MYTSIVIAGGALKVLSVIGIIKYLEEKNLIGDIHNFTGSSAGGIMCLLLALDYKSDDIKQLIIQALKNDKLTNIDPDGIFSILETYGLIDGDNIEEYLDTLIYKKYKKKGMTFIELAKVSGNNLVICVSNLTKEQHEYMCVDNTPNMSIAKAVRISCSIPILYNPVIINENIYLDGGVYNNFPIDYFKDHKLRDILGINIVCKNYQSNDSFFEYIYFIFNSIIKKFNQKSINCNDKNIVTLEFEDSNSWFNLSGLKINISDELFEEYILMGYNSCEKIA
jgi:NTE family protein